MVKRWLCKERCQFPGQQRCREGYVYVFDEGVVPPDRFFEPLEDEVGDEEGLVEESQEDVPELSMRMRRDELAEIARAKGYEIDDGMTKRDILLLLGGEKNGSREG